MRADPLRARTPDAWATNRVISVSAQPARRAPSVYIGGWADRRTFAKHLTVREDRIYYVKGETCVLQTIEQLREWQAVGIVDADNDRITATMSYCRDNVILLDCHDYEAIVLRSPALEDIVDDPDIGVTVPPGHPADLGARANLLRHILLRLALPVGRIRWHSGCRNWYMRSRDMPYASHVDQETWGPDIEVLVDHVGRPHGVSRKELCALATTPVEFEAPWEMCCGHDLAEFLALYMSKRCKNGRQFTRKDVERDLRLAYDSQYFRTTDAYCRLWGWSLKH